MTNWLIKILPSLLTKDRLSDILMRLSCFYVFKMINITESSSK